jgi:hypothetical protein
MIVWILQSKYTEGKYSQIEMTIQKWNNQLEIILLKYEKRLHEEYGLFSLASKPAAVQFYSNIKSEVCLTMSNPEEYIGCQLQLPL